MARIVYFIIIIIIHYLAENNTNNNNNSVPLVMFCMNKIKAPFRILRKYAQSGYLRTK